MKKKKNFPNGFDSWLETFYEIVSTINERFESDEPNATLARDITEAGGRGGRRWLAEVMTDEFEATHDLRFFDDDFFEKVDAFTDRILKESLTPDHRYYSVWYAPVNQ
jgi:hypothetical protein